MSAAANLALATQDSRPEPAALFESGGNMSCCARSPSSKLALPRAQIVVGDPDSIGGSRDVFRKPIQVTRWLPKPIPEDHGVAHAFSQTRHSDRLQDSRTCDGSERGEERRTSSTVSSRSRRSRSFARRTPKELRRSAGFSARGGVMPCSPSSVDLANRSRTNKGYFCGVSAMFPGSSTLLFRSRRLSRRPRRAWR